MLARRFRSSSRTFGGYSCCNHIVHHRDRSGQNACKLATASCSAYEPGSRSSSFCRFLSRLYTFENSILTGSSRTNVSPLYLILFVSATWYLNRPCLYCSLLLTVLVFSLYDWRSDWFEPRNNVFSPAPLMASTSGNHTTTHGNPIREAIIESAASMLNSNVAESARNAVDNVVSRFGGQETGFITGAQWLRELIGKREWRVPCLDVILRL